jgi:hypothetical protein
MGLNDCYTYFGICEVFSVYNLAYKTWRLSVYDNLNCLNNMYIKQTFFTIAKWNADCTHHSSTYHHQFQRLNVKAFDWPLFFRSHTYCILCRFIYGIITLADWRCSNSTRIEYAMDLILNGVLVTCLQNLLCTCF